MVMLRKEHSCRLAMLCMSMIMLGCATTGIDKDSRAPSDPPRFDTAVEPAPIAEPVSPPAPPAPLLPLRKPEGAMALDSLVSLRVTEGSLKEVLQALTEQAGVNLIIDRDVVEESVTINVNNLPLWQALDALLTAYNLYYSSHPGYIRVSRMMTRVFHLDYVRTMRAGLSNTQVSLTSGTSSSETTTSSSGSQSGTSLGALGGGTSAGEITLQSVEVVDFWKDFEANIRQIMRDPLYEILRTEYDQRDLRRNLAMLPYEEEFEKEVMKHRLEMFRLQREMVQKRLETGVSDVAEPIELEAATQAASAEIQRGDSEGTDEGDDTIDTLVGTFSLDSQTGTLVVTSTAEVVDRVESFLVQLKQNLMRQVHIDVQILEVSLENSKKLGVDWSTFPGLIQFYRMPGLTDVINSQMAEQAEGGGGGGGGTTGGEGINSPLITSPFPSSPQGGIDLGVLSTMGNNRAIQYSTSAIISFLQQHGEVNALSRPQITTVNNQPALVSVGVNDFYVTFSQETTSTEGGIATSAVTSQLNPIFIGVTLSITPQISPEGQIAMKIVPAINTAIGSKDVPTGIPSSPTQTIPILETRQTSTMVRVQEGQTIIISGLIQARDNDNKKGVPYLADIPYLGNLFRYTVHEEKNSELVFLLTPRTSDQPVQMRAVGYKELARNR